VLPAATAHISAAVVAPVTMLPAGLAALSKLQIGAAVVGVVAVSVVGAVALGVFGAPSVADVDNGFGEVTDETTVINTDLVVNNPNPVGVQLGDTTINYTVRMNDVEMATGGGQGLDISTGNSTQAFRTEMDNSRIPAWWATHVQNGEQTQVSINATARTSLLGERSFDVTKQREIETDLIGQFNSNETRPVSADDPPPAFDNPLLYTNATRAQWGTVTAERTPIDMEFDLYNPQTLPYAISELGYEITMNGVFIGEGQTEGVGLLPPGSTETVRTTAVMRNQNLDEWWVTHLQNGQTTELRIEFYAVVSGEGLTSDIRVPLDELTYEETIETDIFGSEDTDDTTDDSTTPTPTPESDSTPTPTPTATPTPEPIDPIGGGTPTQTDDGGVLP
jgi:LEA14-like dessication related protein